MVCYLFPFWMRKKPTLLNVSHNVDLGRTQIERFLSGTVGRPQQHIVFNGGYHIARQELNNRPLTNMFEIATCWKFCSVVDGQGVERVRVYS